MLSHYIYHHRSNITVFSSMSNAYTSENVSCLLWVSRVLFLRSFVSNRVVIVPSRHALISYLVFFRHFPFSQYTEMKTILF